MDTITESMYQRIGGGAAVRAAVEHLYNLIQDDVALQPYFAGVEMTGLKRHMAALLSQVLGGPNAYSGRDLGAAHAMLRINRADYVRVCDYVVAVLLIAHVEREVVAAVENVLASVETKIVTRPVSTQAA